MMTTLSYDTSSVTRAIQQVAAKFRAMRWESWLRAEQRSLEGQHRRYFDRQRGPGGLGWKPNAPATIAKKGHARRLHGLPTRGFRLRQSLTLPASEFGIRYEIDHWPTMARVVFGTDAPYHVFNQEGTQHIPARPHLGVTRAYFDKLTRRALDRALAGCRVAF